MITFESLFKDETRLGTKIKTDDYLEYGKYLIIDQGQNEIAGYTNLEDGLYTDTPAIIFGDHTRVIKYINEPFFLGADGTKILKGYKPNSNQKYLYYALRAARIPNLGYSRHFKCLKELKFTDHSESEQKQIVSRLDKLLEIISLKKKKLLLYDELVKARFVEMFDRDFGNNVKLGEVCDVRDGTHDSPKYQVNGYPLVTSKNICEGKIDFTTCNLILQEDYIKISKRSKVDNGDILMPMIGTVGNPIIVNTDKNFAIKNVALIKFKDSNVVLNYFVKALLESDYFDRAVLSKTKGGTQKFISLGDIRKLEFDLPPIDLQKQFTTFVTQVDKSKFAISTMQYIYDEILLRLSDLLWHNA